MLILTIFIYLNICEAKDLAYTGSAYEALSDEQKNTWFGLLHYKNGKSIIKDSETFFISRNGDENPENEYEANLNALISEPKYKCRFPARYRFLSQNKTDPHDCPNYQKYRNNINIENLYYITANEVALDLVSSMGHSLILIDSSNNSGTVSNYIVSYAADTDEYTQTIDLLWDFINSKVSGRYFLRGLSDILESYVDLENRSLWKYRIKLSPNEKEFLTEHLYELKGHNIVYSLLDNNCSNGAEILLASVSNRFLADSFLFDTPFTYAQHLNDNDLIDDIQIIPSRLELYGIENNQLRNPLDYRKPSRISISFLSGKHTDMLEMSFAPAFKNLDDDYQGTFEISSNEILKLTARYDLRHSSVYIKRLDILDFGLIANGIDSDTTVRLFKLSLNGNEFDRHTRLYPQISAVYGYSKKFDFFYPYATINAGIHFEHKANFGIGAEVGFFITNRSIGKIHFLFNKMKASNYLWNGLKNRTEIIWSKLLCDNFSVDLLYKTLYGGKTHKYYNYVSASAVYTF